MYVAGDIITIVGMANCHQPQSRLESKICLLFALMSEGFQASSLFCLPINPSVFSYLMLHGLSHAFWNSREREKKKIALRCQQKGEDEDTAGPGASDILFKTVGSLWFIVRGNENPTELEIKHNNGDKVIAALLSG